MNPEVCATIAETITEDRTVGISFENMSPGIDNYHVDVKLSRRFSTEAKKLIALLVSQLAVPNPKHWDNSKSYERLRNRYQDLMTVLIHRVKTDLTADEICLLQFATVMHVLEFTSSELERGIRTNSSTLADLRNKGSSEALAVDQRLFWLKRNRDSILYLVNKQIIGQFQRAEERQLRTERNQYLGEDYSFTVEALLNPMLWVSEPSALPLLLNEYSVWSWNSDPEDFIKLNEKIEKLLNKRIKPLQLEPLRQPDAEADEAEIHDELSGLFESQPFLGKAADSKRHLGETFSWFEDPENLERVFNVQKNLEQLKRDKKALGFGAAWRKKSEIKRYGSALKAFAKLLRSSKVLPQMLATSYARRSLSPTVLEKADLRSVCQFVSGNLTVEKLQESIQGPHKLTNEQIKSLEATRDKVKSQVGKADHNDALKLLQDYARFRRHLRLYRFAHRAFNRMAMLSDADQIKLSREAGTLYDLPTASEIQEEDARICHHTIMKADVRGSTTVTDELQAKGLNPASYFSMRFFNPINKILGTYGATKVFIEGDALILSFLEYEHAPQQWFSVARACGYSRDMLKIVGSNNRYSTQMGLPLLELGVGICYSNEAPRYLYDEDKPIMISGAIGLADRMSSCSWKLRAAIQKSLFNVDVLRIDEGDASKGEKGQSFIRYNVNGILLDDVAFSKLKSEISLKSLRMKLNGKDYLFHVGQYPDTNGRKKDLVIREGKIGLWKDEQIVDDPNSDDSYFEVVVNRKVLPVVLEAVQARKAAAVS